MKAFVLGAGLGTRLRPLTLRRPKPLIPVCNRPLITYAFDHLAGIGVDQFVVNTHWLPEVYEEEFPPRQYGSHPIVFRNEPDILETAGGIKNVEDLLGGEPFIVYNGDILTDLPLANALDAHHVQGNEVTLVLRSKDGPLQISLDRERGLVRDIGGRLGTADAQQFLFTGIYLVQPEFLRRIPAATKVSVIPIFLEMIRAGAKLGGVVIDDGNWWDLGSREQYLQVHQHLATHGLSSAPWIDGTAQIAAGARITGATAVSANATVGERARLHDCIVWPEAQIAPDAQLSQCIVTGLQRIEGVHSNSDL